MGTDETTTLTSEDDFEASVVAYYPRLVARLSLMVRDPQEARDLAQETFIRAWQAWQTIRRDELGAWLHVVGSRLAYNEMRRRTRHQWVSFGRHELSSDATPDPRLWDALGALKPGERIVLVLNVLGGYSHDEIANALGVAPGTVSSWLTRARQRLRGSDNGQE